MALTQGQSLNNRYTIVNLLGQGGFGAVYRAWDTVLEHPCAIKENQDVTSDAQRQFLREARMLANLAHPNLPRVSDYFILPGQGQYLVMDFVEGQDLQDLLRQTLQKSGQPLPEGQVVSWIAQICDALTYLHSQNPPIIHRDIKPGNIKITPEGKAMLVDFGIAKTYAPGELTTQGARAVTPGYSPIEQYGQGLTDARSDVYALGATLYALLTGQSPPESIGRVSSDPLAPPEQLNPSLSAGVCEAVRRAMQIDPWQRYQSIALLKAALVSQKAVEVGVAPPTVHVEPGRRDMYRWAMGLVGVVAIAGAGLVVVVIGWLIWRGLQSARQANITPTGALPAVASPAASATAPVQATEAVLTASPPGAGQIFTAGATQIAAQDDSRLIYIPAGQFWMGSTDVEAGLRIDQLPKHQVTLGAYWIDRTEVTNAMYKRCVEAGACRAPVKSDSATRKLYYGNPDYADYPVIWISWDDASDYCRWAGRRLPSEAEWERAARGDAGSNNFPWGSTPPTGERVNFCDANCSLDWKDASIDDGFADTSPVGYYQAGASLYGLLDMAGNVWEWVNDFYDKNFYQSASSVFVNPFGPASGTERVLRGGSFENAEEDIRSANRFSFGQDAATSSFGFRCAVEAK